MNFLALKRFCHECGHVLNGRRDQKYCSDQCRNTYNNRHYSDLLHKNRKINRILHANKLILLELAQHKRKKHPIRIFQEKGFQFEFHTHTRISKAGQTIFYCYDYGYLRIHEDCYLIIHEE